MVIWVPSLFLFGFAALLFHYGRLKLRLAEETKRRGDASLTWPTTQGTITASTVEVINDGEGEGEGFFLPKVSYLYSVGSETFAGSAIAHYMPENTRAKATAIVSKYPVGSSVPVSYDPNDPRFCVLEPGASGLGRLRRDAVIAFVLAVFFIAVAIAIPVLRQG